MVQEFVIYSGNRVSELSNKLYPLMFEIRNCYNPNKIKEVLADVSCTILELEEHQRVLEEKLQNERNFVVIAQADQYQTDINKVINAYKSIEKLLNKRLPE